MRATALALAVLVTTAAGVQSVRLWRQSAVAPLAPEARLEIASSITALDNVFENAMRPAISPDGLKIAYTLGSEGQAQLWVRSLDSSTPRLLSGTTGATLPFWSPDSASVAFFADNRLKRVDLDGGSVTVLATAPFGGGGSWNEHGTIVLAPMLASPIFRVPASGGELTQVTRVAPGQTAHQLPHFLPDGDHFLYSALSSAASGAVYVGRLDGSAALKLIDDAESAVFHRPSQRLLFVRQGALFSQPFDPDRLTLSSSPSLVAQSVAAVSASDAGPVAYRGATTGGRRQFTWFDRTGATLGTVGKPDGNIFQGNHATSPDGVRLAVHRLDASGQRDIWLLELARGVLTRFTFGPNSNLTPEWSPDGRTIAFTSDRGGRGDLYTKDLAGGENETLLLSTPQSKTITDWSLDGRFLLFRSVDPVTSHDLWALPLEGDRKPFVVVRTPFVDPYGQFSPDGQWVAFQSDESGQAEVYVQAFPKPGAKVRISTNGGAQMRWRRDGRELFYIGLDGRMMAVPITLGDGRLTAGEPAPLFTTRVGGIVPLRSGYYEWYTTSPDGSKFLINTVVEETRAAPITVILNWKPR